MQSWLVEFFICTCIHSTNGKIPVLILYAYLKLSTADEIMINSVFYLYFDSFHDVLPCNKW